jgi:hypothetical protein
MGQNRSDFELKQRIDALPTGVRAQMTEILLEMLNGSTVRDFSCDTLIATTDVTVGGVSISGGEIGVLDGVTAGIVTANKAIIADASKDIAQFRNLKADNIIAGAAGRVGAVDVYAAGASSGKFQLSHAGNTGDTTTNLTNDAHGQTTVTHLGDPGASVSYVLQTSESSAATCTVTSAEINTLDGVQTAIALPVNGVQATLSNEPAVDGNDKLTYTAVSYTKATGEAVTVTHLGGVSQTLAVTVAGSAITIQLATDGGSVVTSTAANVKTAYDLVPAAVALATVAFEGNGSGLAGVKAVTSLSGGVDVTAGPVGGWRFKTSDFSEGYVKVSAQVWKKFALSAV